MGTRTMTRENEGDEVGAPNPAAGAAPANDLQHGKHDNEEVRQAIRAAVEEMKQLVLERKELNAKFAAVRAGIENRGINKRAFADALTYSNLTEPQADGYDISLAVCRKAIDLPIQQALFADEASGPKH